LKASLHRYGSRRARGLVGAADFRQLVEGVAGETFARAIAQPERYDPSKGPVIWWLYMLGRKRMALELRRLERQRQSCEAMAGALEPARARGGREFRQILERDRLGRALRGLPREQHQALGLFYLYGLSLEEVGKVLGKSAAAVSSLLQRARKNARKGLEQGGVGTRSRDIGKETGDEEAFEG
jgi:RNA polymerase sigma-70 factor (ECF subfamily)